MVVRAYDQRPFISKNGVPITIGSGPLSIVQLVTLFIIYILFNTFSKYNGLLSVVRITGYQPIILLSELDGQWSIVRSLIHYHISTLFSFLIEHGGLWTIFCGPFVQLIIHRRIIHVKVILP